MVTLFRRLRSLMATGGVTDDQSVDAYLAFLSRLIVRGSIAGEMQPLPDIGAGEEILNSLSETGVESLMEDALRAESFSRALTLFPSLAIRHAGSDIFQEAHFEVIKAFGPDLLGYAAPAETRRETRGGAHFTPPAVARSIVEQSIFHFGDISKRQRLVILDPACGSGAFLHEALRTVRRFGFCGELLLVGRDVSRAAASMARFVLQTAIRDWTPAGGLALDIGIGDSLDEDLPQADIVLMNPPFVSWQALTDHQRNQMQRILGEQLQGRGDYSMPFVVRALNALGPGGVVGTLIPASLLTLQSAEPWRSRLASESEVRFIASLGEYGLFAYALVQIAALVARKKTDQDNAPRLVTALTSANDPEAMGDALRSLRREAGKESVGRGWQIFQVAPDTLRDRPTWRLLSPGVERELRRVVDRGAAVEVQQLFDVKQGVRTGANSILVILPEEVMALPVRERKWFRPAVMNDSIQNGKLSERHFVFYPYDQKGLALEDEAGLKKAVPGYYEKFLQPAHRKLAQRSSIRGGVWWGLSERRASWALDRTPRIISKYFGGPGGFALDVDSKFIVVQGFAWMPKWTDEVSGGDALSLRDLLAAFAAVFNSAPFGALLEYFSPHVAGGQFDLSPRYVDRVPIPNLLALATNKRFGKVIAALAELGRGAIDGDASWRRDIDRLTTELYGADFSAP
jgi:adenine-specific DNA-methyltransferase